MQLQRNRAAIGKLNHRRSTLGYDLVAHRQGHEVSRRHKNAIDIQWLGADHSGNRRRGPRDKCERNAEGHDLHGLIIGSITR
jgi:hypothetical protein